MNNRLFKWKYILTKTLGGGYYFCEKKGEICNLKVVYIGLFFTLLVLLALTIRYLVSFLMGNNDESLNYQIKCLELDKEIKRLEDFLNQKEIDTENKVVLEKVPEDIIFTEELEKLDDEHKKYYDAIVSYALSLKDVNVNVRKSYETLTYGKGKIIGKIVVLNGTLIVKFNFGKIKVSKEVEPLLLKTIKIEVKSEKEVEQVKKQIDIGYIKQSGQLKIEMRNGELV